MKKAALFIVAIFIMAIFLLNVFIPKMHTQKSLCIMELGRLAGPEYVYLPNDYGFLIYWLDNNEPELYTYNEPEHKINMTSDFAVFLSYLQLFPDGVKVDQIRGCGITALGMSQENKKLLEELIENKKFRLTNEDDNNWGVCSCETLYVHRYNTAKDF
jgi:hypothetical protein